MNTLASKDFVYLLPLGTLVLVGLVLVLAEAFTKGSRRQYLMHLAVAGCVATVAVTALLAKGASTTPQQLFGGMLVFDRTAAFLSILFAVTAALTALITFGHQSEHDWEQGEFYGLLLLSTAGMIMLAMARDLVTVFLGIETLSLGVYVMCAARRNLRAAGEGAMKYFLMGAFASGFLIYGIAMLYGAAGTTDLGGISQAIASGAANTQLVVVGVLLLVVAFGFKVALVPFHMWAPDAYEGAPTPVTAYMAAGVKAAAFAGLARVFIDGLGGSVVPFGAFGWTTIFAVLAAITMTVGNIAALRQENVKRMLAYSSVSHAGVIMVGIVAAGVEPSVGLSSVLFYLAGYSVTTMGAFAVLVWLGSRDRERVLVSDFNGLGAVHPAVAVAMTLCMLSFGGIPPTVGFFGKFVIFKTALQVYDQQLFWLVVIGVLNSVISIFYYLRVVMAMWFREPVGTFKPIRTGAIAVAIVLAAFMVLQMGLMPSRWLAYAGG